MIDNDSLNTILTTEKDITTVCEIYAADATPSPTTGFDPGDALACYAPIAGVTFQGASYDRLITGFGGIKRTIDKESNSASVTFSNVSREISRFEFDNGFEGLIMVIRTISRGASVDIEESLILFAGRCEKPTSGNKDSLTVTAKWILGGLEVQIPRRKYTKEDQDGRVSTDDEFEGFPYMPSQNFGSVSYSVRVKRGGLWGLLGFKKTVNRTTPFSSFSDLDANKAVPEVFGTSQLQGTHIAYADRGTSIYMRTAFCEGEILDMRSVRSLDARLALTAANEVLGLTGSLNTDATWLTASPPDPSAGYYSRTAYVRASAGNTAVEDEDPAPDVVAIIDGRLMTIPDGSGDWLDTGEWTDNGTAHLYFVITSEDYYNLDAAWIDEAAAYESYQYNDQLIITRNASDFTFLIAG